MTEAAVHMGRSRWSGLWTARLRLRRSVVETMGARLRLRRSVVETMSARLQSSRSVVETESAPRPFIDVSTWARRAVWFVGLMTALRLLVLATTGLSDTEAYYYTWSRFPAWSYYDHPPMVAWMTSLTTLVFRSAFSARIGAVICSALLGGMVYRFASRLFSPRAGFFALVAVSVPPVFFFTGFLINPEGPLAPMWVLILWLLYLA